MANAYPVQLFSMLKGYRPITNLLGMGDPNVHFIDGQWWMFFGGFQRNFKNNLFSASLTKGEPLGSNMKWQITADSGNNHRAMPLIEQPSPGGWDGYGLHEPCFAEGIKQGKDGLTLPCRRIYYTGRKSKRVLANDQPFSIGFLELTEDGWRRHPKPVLTGDERNPNVLAPKVIYHEGNWRMWYRATPKEAPKGELPQYEIYYTESKDGISGWKKPVLFFNRKDQIAHAYPLPTKNGLEMLVSTSPNLYGESGYPKQALRHFHCIGEPGNRDQWQGPASLLKAEDGEAWYQGGFFGSSFCEPGQSEDSSTRHVFFTGIHAPFNKLLYSLRKLLTLKLPPIPAPFYFAIGYYSYDLSSKDQVE
ncbi:hypothetical protein EBB07_30465 [Paenibacillaceae bacterium]|nr:hypothetical protein EBB07_30465 [Paenibacillaceae bacterium]